ncbi:MAG: HAD family hydrolase [Deltaproteobacteria bacterium]|nr:MAG: HAD family hydrolase [Deltaproteobacteria bacterium]
MLDKDTLSKYIRPLLPIPTVLHQRGLMEERVKCILFDIYGTLFISASGDISIAQEQSPKMRELEQLLLNHQIRKTPQTLLQALFQEIERKHAQLRHQGTDYPEVDIVRIWMHVLNDDHSGRIRKFAAEFEMLINPVYPMPRLREMLSAFRKRKMLMGIISNAQFYTPYLFQWFLDSTPEALGFSPDLTFFSYQFGYAKPSAFLFHKAADALEPAGISPHSVLYVGNDMLNDIMPAMKTGFKTALFAGDNRSLRLREAHALCKDISPDLVITDIGQLPDCVKG